MYFQFVVETYAIDWELDTNYFSFVLEGSVLSERLVGRVCFTRSFLVVAITFLKWDRVCLDAVHAVYLYAPCFA